MKLFLDCSQTLVYGMFDPKGPTPIIPVVEAVKIFSGRYPEADIIVWTFSTEKDARSVADMCFPELKVTAIGKKEYSLPQNNDIVVDDQDEVWSEPEEYPWLPSIKFYTPDDFVRAVRNDEIQIGEI